MESASSDGFATLVDERPSRRAQVGRICKDPDCGTRLSIYNDGAHCALHAPMVVPRTRGKKLPAA